MHPKLIVLCTLVFAVGVAQAQQPTSTASAHSTMWLSQTAIEKTAFLDGVCLGLNAGGHPSGALKCSQEVGQTDRGFGNRFCGIRYGTPPDATGVFRTGADILDAFYLKPANANVPLARAIEHYDAKACKQTNRQ